MNTDGNQSTKGTLDIHMKNEAVTRAEIMWALNVMSNLSLNSCKQTADLFRSMFPDSSIAKGFASSSSKCSYVICHGIAPFFKTLLLDELKALFYVMSYDESLNHITQTDQMDLIVQFWDNNKKRVQVRYFDSGFLGNTGGKQLLEKFHELTEKLIPTRLIQISMGGPNVNWKFLELLAESRLEAEVPSLINIGNCGIHVMHGAFKTDAKASGWGVSKILKALARLFLDSSDGRADYVELTGSSPFPMSFCATGPGERQ